MGFECWLIDVIEVEAPDSRDHYVPTTVPNKMRDSRERNITFLINL
jgi:hypothetical protein